MAASGDWFYVKDGETVGPVDRSELLRRLPAVGGADTLVYGPGTPEWTRAGHVGIIARELAGSGGPPPAPTSRSRIADEIDYEIFGDDMQFVEVTLDPGEVVVAEAGAMMYMTSGIEMETVLGDASGEAGLLDKLFAAGKRMVTGESLFLTTFGNAAAQRERVSFAAPYPGSIIPLHVDELGGEILCQKSAFLCAARGTKVGIAFQKRIGVGLFGREGFIMQRIQGDGLAFVHAGGTVVQRELAAGEVLRLDTGCLVALQPTVDYDIQTVGGIKNAVFGGEGLFLATLRGPGRIWLQSLPFSRLAGRLVSAFPAGKGEGSVIGGLSNLFESK